MIFYSHRGNLQGRNPERENTLDYLNEAIAAGFHVEIDIWRPDADPDLWLGYDGPRSAIDTGWLTHNCEYLLLHAKNLAALRFVEELYTGFHCFAHTSDPFVYTSHRKVWLHEVKPDTTDECIVPLLDLPAVEDFDLAAYPGLHGICSDYVLRCRERFQPTPREE